MLHVMAAVARRVVPSLLFALLPLTPLAAQESGATRAVLVTGTSSGIGLRITEVLSQNGFFVYAGARKPADLARLDAMENVKAVRLDVTIQSEIDAAVALVRREGRGLYALVNNAGIAEMEPLIEMAEADMQYLIDVNLLGPYRVTKAFADLLIESRGRVMTVTSIAGILAGPFSGAYSMSKHGAEAYTDALAAELDRFGVEVAAVEPGNYKSQIVASMIRRMQERGYSAEGSRYGSILDLMQGPLDRSQFKEPYEVAEAVLEFLTADTPRRRYMVVPNQGEAQMTILQALREAVQLNDGHQYSYSRDELVAMLDQVLEEQSAIAQPAGDLHVAVVSGDLEAVRQHIESGSNLNAREPAGGSSPLITAATFGQTEIARALIAAGADLDQQNNDGSTALFSAAFFCRTEIVEALLTAGADRSIPNATGATPLDAVSAPFASMKPVYDFVGAMLGPLGLKLDYAYLEATRPVIAEMLRKN